MHGKFGRHGTWVRACVVSLDLNLEGFGSAQNALAIRMHVRWLVNQVDGGLPSSFIHVRPSMHAWERVPFVSRKKLD